MNHNVTSPPELFSEEWACAWKEAINGSPYRKSGSSWTDPLLVRMDDGPSFLLDLSGGECRSVERIPEESGKRISCSSPWTSSPSASGEYSALNRIDRDRMS